MDIILVAALNRKDVKSINKILTKTTVIDEVYWNYLCWFKPLKLRMFKFIIIIENLWQN